MAKDALKTALYLFAFLGICFIPIDNRFFTFHFAEAVFGGLISIFTNLIFARPPVNMAVTSDSTSMYVLFLILLLLSVVLTFILQRISKWHEVKGRVLEVMRALMVFFLSWQLMRYGFDKVFKGQFYLPEPNTLYTPLGMVDRDLLFWSVMGTSWFYSFFTGLMEVLAACLLLFRKTRFAGALIAIVVLVNILAINIGFDISVKSFSGFLFILALIIAAPYLKELYEFVFLRRVGKLTGEPVVLAGIISFPVRTALKTFICGLIFIEVLYPYMYTGRFNDDLAERPYLHGAYEVTEVLDDTGRVSRQDWPVKRLFIHRNGYVIFQDLNDRMQDYRLYINQNTGEFLLTDYQLKEYRLPFTYNEKDSVLRLQYHHYRLNTKSLDWRKLPALQPKFHWRVEE